MKIAVAKPFEISKDKEKALQRAKRIEWASLAAPVSIVLLLAFVMGASQTMKVMWVEDTLSLIPSRAFLIGFRYRHKRPDENSRTVIAARC